LKRKKDAEKEEARKEREKKEREKDEQRRKKEEELEKKNKVSACCSPILTLGPITTEQLLLGTTKEEA
jgi:hypothetical protein